MTKDLIRILRLFARALDATGLPKILNVIAGDGVSRRPAFVYTYDNQLPSNSFMAVRHKYYLEFFVFFIVKKDEKTH